MRQRETLVGIHRVLRQTEQGAEGQTQRLAGLGGQTAANDQRNAATGAHFVKQHITLDLELGNHLAVLECLAFIGTQLHQVTHVHLAHVQFNRQRARVFHGVVENRSDLAAQTHAAKALVRHERNIFTGEPQHRVGGGLAAGARAHHVAHVGHQIAFGFEAVNELDRTALAIFLRRYARPCVFVHGQGVQRDVRAAKGVGRR